LTKQPSAKFLAAAEKQEFVSHIFLATFENSHLHFFFSKSKKILEIPGTSQ
jgi:hypothetical protein